MTITPLMPVYPRCEVRPVKGEGVYLIGEGGERLKRIGTEARQEMEKLMQAKVFLELWVKVRSGWADDEARVRSFGYE